MQGHLYISSFKLILKAILLGIIVVSGVKWAGATYSSAAKENKINAFTKERFEGLYALEKNTLDMVFIGSSHSYCTFDPEIIDSILGTNSWQLGTPSQHPDTSYYLLREVLNYQKPKTVVMEVYWDMCDDKFEPKQAESFFEVLKNENLKEEYVQEVFPLGEKVKNQVPAIRYQQDYFSFKSKEIEKEIEKKYNVTKPWVAKANGTEYYQSKGYVYCDIVIDEGEHHKTNQYRALDGKRWVFDPVQKSYLEKIIETCKQEGINLVFVTAPVANVSMDFIKNYEHINQQISGFAEENNVPYIDYNMVNQEEKLFVNDNFRDDAHLNHSGVEILDKHFATWFSEGLN